jgi:hypothetical protein
LSTNNILNIRSKKHNYAGRYSLPKLIIDYRVTSWKCGSSGRVLAWHGPGFNLQYCTKEKEEVDNRFTEIKFEKSRAFEYRLPLYCFLHLCQGITCKNDGVSRWLKLVKPCVRTSVNAESVALGQSSPGASCTLCCA